MTDDEYALERIDAVEELVYRLAGILAQHMPACTTSIVNLLHEYERVLREIDKDHNNNSLQPEIISTK